MKTKNRIWIFTLLIATVGTLAFIHSCKKDDNPDKKVITGSLTLLDEQCYHYGFVTLECDVDIANFDGSITIGDTVLTTATSEGKQIVFFVDPGVNTGSQKLRLNTNGQTFEFTITVNSVPSIPNPTQYVNGLIQDVNTGIDKLSLKIDTLAKYGGINSSIDKNILKLIKDSLNYYQQKFTLLPANEKLIAAQVLEANKSDINTIMTVLDPLTTEIYDQRFFKKGGDCNQLERSKSVQCMMAEYERISIMGNIAGKLSSILTLLSKVTPGHPLLELPYKILAHQMSKVEEQYFLAGFWIGSKPYHATEIMVSNAPTNPKNNEWNKIDVNIKYRNVKEIPEEKDQPWEKTFANRLKNDIDNYNSSWINKGFGLHRDFPVLINPILLAEDSNVLDVKKYDDKILFQIHGGKNNVQVKFSTFQTTTQNFEYKIVYWDGIFEVKGASVFASILGTTSPTFVTKKPDFITTNTAYVGGWISSDGGDKITDRGVCWSTLQPPLKIDNYQSLGSDTGDFNYTITGLASTTKYYVRSYITSSKGTNYGNEVSFTTNGTATDYDGNIYHLVTIGSQTWMMENLKTTHYRDGTSINVAKDTFDVYFNEYYSNYNFDVSLGDVYGRLYNIKAALNINTPPTGFRLPTNDDFTLLIQHLGGDSIAGGKLKETEYTHWDNPNTKANNLSGFAGLGSGYFLLYKGDFSGLKRSSNFLCRNSAAPNYAGGVLALKYDSGVGKILGVNGSSACSIRCIKE